VVGRAATAARPFIVGMVGARGDGECALNHSTALPITGGMSIQAVMARVQELRQELTDPADLVNGPQPRSGAAAAATGGAQFSTALAQATGSYPTTAAGAALGASYGSPETAALGASPYSSALGGATGGGAGSRIVAAAESQIGQSEQPPGSNESPAIAEYRSATAGAMPGEPWCAYFASWASRAAGEPIGSSGQGLGSVSEIWSWAQSTGRAIPNGPGAVPKPGDLIVFGGEHVGIVRGVLPNGEISTIEGNYENKVATNTRSASEATGYVSM